LLLLKLYSAGSNVAQLPAERAAGRLLGLGWYGNTSRYAGMIVLTHCNAEWSAARHTASKNLKSCWLQYHLLPFDSLVKELHKGVCCFSSLVNGDDLLQIKKNSSKYSLTIDY
jgi:hypothetical protein